MSQRYITVADLNDWLTRELQMQPECEGSKLTMKYRLREPDPANGCNWSEATVRIGFGCDAGHVGAVAARIVDRARLQFNVLCEKCQELADAPVQTPALAEHLRPQTPVGSGTGYGLREFRTLEPYDPFRCIGEHGSCNARWLRVGSGASGFEWHLHQQD